MSYSISSTESQALTALGNVLVLALPSSVQVIQGQDNRVSEPAVPNFVVMQPIIRTRLSTNVDCYEDCAFIGSVLANVLTVTESPTIVMLGKIQPNLKPTLFGQGVMAGTKITAQTGGAPGGAGTYTVSVPQTLSSRPLAAGVLGMKQPTQLVVQCDVHGPASADNVQVISTIMRSAYGSDLFKDQNLGVALLYASDPRQSPFWNAESQIEKLWSIDINLQVSPVVSVPMQFFDAIQITLNPPVDASV